MKKVTIATDSFKGSLTAVEATTALAEGLLAVCPAVDVEQIPLADGGEGSADVLLNSMGGEWVEMEACDPIGRPIRSRYGVVDGGVAVMDVASVVGLGLLTPSERNPMVASSRGVGQMIRHAIERGSSHLIVGLGGSATSDCGVGMLAELGFDFLDSGGQRLEPTASNLVRVDTIVPPTTRQRLFDGVRIEVATDVDSPLCGPFGSARMFAPQKGAMVEDVDALECGAANFAKVVGKLTGRDMLTKAGAGAAGGMGGAQWALLGGDICSGGELVADRCRFDQRAAGSDLVITGEGCVDSQTMRGKLPSVVAQRATRLGIATIAVGGKVRWNEVDGGHPFGEVVAATPEGMTLEEAMRPEVAKANLRRVGAVLAGKYLL